ncbi:SHOCT domain-containing protein [Ectobacillus polymachus]|uniref:SHOCT domain-containing protein n=1 Tax=Ectobacillus polymachus TaxID=1508806 RepID=UPI003A8994C3
MGNGFHPFYGGDWIMTYGMILFWIVLLILLIIGYNMVQKTLKLPKEQTNAIDILKETFAKGEITEEEYDRMLKKLTE